MVESKGPIVEISDQCGDCSDQDDCEWRDNPFTQQAFLIVERVDQDIIMKQFLETDDLPAIISYLRYRIDLLEQPDWYTAMLDEALTTEEIGQPTMGESLALAWWLGYERGRSAFNADE